MSKSVSVNTESCNGLVLALLLLALMQINLNGQEIWTSDQFLNFDASKGELPYQENLNFIGKAKGMPFIDRYEFRTETDEMILDQQQYQFRFKFNSNEERKAYDKILIANKNKYLWMQAQYELDLWEEKYKNILDLYFYQKEMKLLREDLELLADKRTVLKKILDSETKVDVSDWITNEGEIFNVQSDSLELELQMKGISQRIFGSERLAPRLDESDFIQVSKIREMITQIMNDEGQHPDEGLAGAEQNLAKAEYNLEIAEGKRWLEFAQIQFQAEDKLSFQREFSLGTSITIPSKNNNRVKKNDAALELLEKNYESRIEQEENKKELLSDEAKILRLIEQHEVYIKMREKQKLNATFESFSEKKIVSPLVLIGIKRSILSNSKKQLDLEKDIFELYISLLTKKAVFLKVPRKNYLKIE